MAHLITGRAGYAHVTAADEAKINKALYGNLEAAIDYGNNFAITLPSSNTVGIDTGVFCMQGRWIDIPVAETLTLENGNSGLNRNDLVVLRYSANSDTGVETAELAVKKGTAAASAVDPELEQGDIDGGALVNEVALYRIPISGINVGTPVKLFSMMHIRAEVDAKGNNIADTYATKKEVENTYAKKSALGDQITVTVTTENGVNVCRIERKQ